MKSNNWKKLLFWLTKANMVMWIINILLLAVFFLFNHNLIALINSAFFSKTLLLEAGITFLVGGLIVFSSGIISSKVKKEFFHKQQDWSAEKLREDEKKANQYIILGATLFLQSLAVSFLSL
jgi:hypothetical protein